MQHPEPLILVVDDCPIIRHLVLSLLLADGHKVIAAASLTEAKALMDMGEHGRSLLYDDGKENKCSPDPSYGYRQDLVYTPLALFPCTAD